MRLARISVPLVLVLAVIGLAVLYGPTIVGRVAYAVAVKENQANREHLAQLSQRDRISELFRAVSETVKPAVVVVHVKQRVVAPSVPELDMDEFFRRFFGEDSPFGRPSPGPFDRQLPKRRSSPRREYYARGLGSGVIVDAKNGYILTNWHVVRDADEVEVVLADKRRLSAEWVRTDRHTDLAIIKIDADSLVEAPLGDSDAMDVGDLVLAIGAPEGLPQTVTMGIISAKSRTTGRGGYEDFIQTDAAINHGNSGGPLVNMRGEVIGINTAIISRTGVNEGIGLAIPSNMAKNIMEQLIEKGKVVRGYLGVRIQPVTGELARSFGLSKARGALVAQIAAGGPAEKAGFQVGDIIVAINGKETETVNEVRNTIAALPVGKTVPIRVLRNGQEMTLNVAIAAQPADMERAFGGYVPEQTADLLGISVATPTPELAEEYGYEELPEGVVITRVEADSPAEEQGLREGMVIKQVQETDVKTAEEFTEAIEAADMEKGVRLLVTDPRGRQRFVFLAPED